MGTALVKRKGTVSRRFLEKRLELCKIIIGADIEGMSGDELLDWSLRLEEQASRLNKSDKIYPDLVKRAKIYLEAAAIVNQLAELES